MSDQASLVEVRVVAVGESRTEVGLTQRNRDTVGDMARMMRDGYGSNWCVVFEKACSA